MRSRRVAILLSAVALAGCGSSFPADPEDTLSDVRSEGVMQVGASPRDGWVDVSSSSEPTGREPRLVEEFADHLGVEIEWTVAGEEQLATLLDEGTLDLAVGGVTEDNRWVGHVALTRPYTEVEVDGTTEAHVMMVRMGENAFQSELERWLDEHGEDGS